MNRFFRYPVAALVLSAASSPALAQSETLCGLHRGFVTDTRDPDGRGRLQLSIPSAGSDRPWAERLYPRKPFRVATASIGDQVFVQFEACNPTRPLVIGFARP
jgi:hypothetical protein